MVPVGVNPLGRLEMAVMEHVWKTGQVDVKATHVAIGMDRGITANTIQSTLERLWRKGLLEREKQGHAYVYSARLTRDEFGGRILRDVVTDVLGGVTAPILVAFVDVAERAGAEDLLRLEKLVADRLSNRRRGGKG